MTILVTGADGQLGREIQELSKKQNAHSFLFTDIGSLDITDYKALDDYFNQNKTDIVINCAAYTAVDKAEADKKAARLINTDAPGLLASLSINHEFKIIQISTDFIFDGKKSSPYLETDKARPLSYYGLTKYEGEKKIIKKVPSYIILRTSWLYSSYGNNFVKTMLRLAKENDSIRVVYDQTGTPTYARDLAAAIMGIIPQFKDNTKEIYHFSNEGAASWYDFAKAVCEIAGIKTPVFPIETKDYPTPAKRPAYSVLNKAKIKKDFNITIPHWRDSLKECLELILK